MIKALNRQLPERLPLAIAKEQADGILSDVLRGAYGSVAEATRHLAAKLGKGARSTLLLACAADGEMDVPKDAVYAAVAIELFHLATLVHDDVIDDADTRRGIESVQSKWGKKGAVVVGDYLLCLSLGALSKIQDARGGNDGLAFAVSNLPSLAGICLGEFSQLMNSKNLSLSPGEYLRIISGKTAELFRIAALAGASLGGFSRDEARKAGWFGWNLGIVFQIIDDCKDYELSAQAAQKPVKRDLPQGVVTMPLIMALLGNPELSGMASKAMSGQKASDEAARLVKEAGGVEKAMRIARRFAEKAEGILGRLALHQRTELSAILSRTLNAAGDFTAAKA